jgi:hypothetical protein
MNANWRWLLLPCLAAVATTARAVPPQADPNWPCQQIKVPEVSVAAVWAGPPIDAYLTTWSKDPDIAELAPLLIARRVAMPDAEAEIADFARRNNHDPSKLLALFAGVFELANQERGSVVAGLDRFGSRQKQLAAEIRAESSKLNTPTTGAAAAAQQTGELQNRLTWDLQVFRDRRESLSYACQAPDLIEQRLFALSRVIQRVLPPAGQ